MQLPMDPVILLRYVNTQLRGAYPSLKELCHALCVEEQGITHTLDGIGYAYDAAQNRFLQDTFSVTVNTTRKTGGLTEP